MSTPVSAITLYRGVPLDNSYRNTFTFTSKTNQVNYFSLYDPKFLQNYTYLRKGEPIRVEGHADTYGSYNYLSYLNEQGKRYYCFITQIEYINDRTTALYIEVDVMQTFQFDYSFLSSFVQREHQQRWKDVNLESDNLDLGGEYVVAKETTVYNISPQYVASVTTIVMSDGQEVELSPQALAGVPSSLWYAVLTPEEVDAKLGAIGKAPAVVSLAKLPLDVCDLSRRSTLGTRTVIYPSPDADETAKPTVGRLELPFVEDYNPVKALGSVTANGYGFTKNTSPSTPFNPKFESKFLTYPYTYGLLSDCQAQPLLVKHEYAPATMTVKGVGSISHDPKAKYYIEGYRGDTQGKFDVLLSEKDRQLPLTSDAYANYIMNNSTQIRTAQAFNVVSTGLNVAKNTMTAPFNPVGAGVGVVDNLYSGFQYQKSELAKQTDLANMPDSVRSMGNNVAFDIVDNNNKIMYYHMSISDEAIERIGQFWHMYGYPVNRVKKPNLKTRHYFNYVKTIGANIQTNIEMDYARKICAIFDNGVTLWHNRVEGQKIVFDYYYDNTEV